jgi:hypothetical protein
MTVPHRLVVGFLAVVAAPLAIVFASGLAIIGGTAIGMHPFWPTPDLTVSEYAAVTDTADVVRLLQSGVDPNGAFHVRPAFLMDWYNAQNDSAFTKPGMTLFETNGMYRPLQVAVIVRQPGLVRTLIRAGGTLPGGTRVAAVCFASAHHDDGIVQSLLATGDGTDPRASCPPPIGEHE